MTIGVQVAAWFRGHFAAPGADGHGAVVAHAHAAAQAPGVVPPGIRFAGAQGVARAVQFLAVVVLAQLLQQLVVDVDVAAVLHSEEGGQAALPVVVKAFDFSFGLWCGRVEKAHAVMMQGGGELGGVRIVGVEQAMVVHVERQGQAVGEESPAQEVVIALEQLALIQSRACDPAGAVVNDVDQMPLGVAAAHKLVRDAVHLPDLAKLLALPAAHAGSVGDVAEARCSSLAVRL